MLSVFLSEELERLSTTNDTQSLFFFCSHQDDKRNTAVAILRGFIYQIVTKRPTLIKHALPYFETPERTHQTLSSLETLWCIFSKLISDADLGTTFCVLDGLDECDQNTLNVLVPRIIGLLSPQASSPTPVALRLAILSRDIPGLCGCARVRLDPDNDENIVSDIERFISTRVGELSSLDGIDDQFRKAVLDVLLKRADGTFLWVGFAMHELLQKRTCSEVLQALDDLPPGLPAIYSRMLLQIPADRRQNSALILKWVTLAMRPLQLQELAAAVGVLPTSPLISAEQAIRDAVALVGPFVKIQEQAVHLVHQSARDYLLREECDSNAILEDFRIKPEKAHLDLARTCFDCVVRSGLQRTPINFRRPLSPQENPLIRYATFHWPTHARGSSSLATKLFDPAGLFFQTHSPLRKHWWTTYEQIVWSRRHSSPTILQVASNLGIVPWVEAILAKGGWRLRLSKQIDRTDESGRTALDWAISGGNETVVQLLVKSKANPKRRDSIGRTTLHRTASTGNEDVARLMIKSGVEVNAKDIDGRTALFQAVYNGKTAVAQLLINNGAVVNAKDRNGVTALHLAARDGHEAVVQLLIDRGVDVNTKDVHGRSALHEAACTGNEAAVKLLLDRGADVRTEDNEGCSALHEVTLHGNTAILQLLVDAGVNIDAKNKSEKTALHRLAARWNEKVEIRQQIDSETKNKDKIQALLDTSTAKTEAMTRLLVTRGADVNAKDRNGWTVLSGAARSGNLELVKLLLDNGGDVNSKDNNGYTPLHQAASALDGGESIVRLLLVHGAGTQVNNDGNSALDIAISVGNGAVVQLLTASLTSSDVISVLEKLIQESDGRISLDGSVFCVGK